MWERQRNAQHASPRSYRMPFSPRIHGCFLLLQTPPYFFLERCRGENLGGKPVAAKSNSGSFFLAPRQPLKIGAALHRIFSHTRTSASTLRDVSAVTRRQQSSATRLTLAHSHRISRYRSEPTSSCLYNQPPRYSHSHSAVDYFETSRAPT